MLETQFFLKKPDRKVLAFWSYQKNSETIRLFVFGSGASYSQIFFSLFFFSEEKIFASSVKNVAIKPYRYTQCIIY